MFEEQHEEGFVELKGAWELAEDLPHTVQEEKKNRRLLARLAVGVGGLGAALLERVTRLGQQQVGHEPKKQKKGKPLGRDSSPAATLVPTGPESL